MIFSRLRFAASDAWASFLRVRLVVNRRWDSAQVGFLTKFAPVMLFVLSAVAALVAVLTWHWVALLVFLVVGSFAAWFKRRYWATKSAFIQDNVLDLQRSCDDIENWCRSSYLRSDPTARSILRHSRRAERSIMKLVRPVSRRFGGGGKEWLPSDSRTLGMLLNDLSPFTEAQKELKALHTERRALAKAERRAPTDISALKHRDQLVRLTGDVKDVRLRTQAARRELDEQLSGGL